MIKFLKKEKHFKKEKESTWLNIHFYWKLSVCFMLTATFLSLLLGYYFFTGIRKETEVETGSAVGSVETIKKDRIDKALQYFSERESRSNEILNSPSPIIDPSL